MKQSAKMKFQSRRATDEEDRAERGVREEDCRERLAKSHADWKNWEKFFVSRPAETRNDDVSA